VCAIILVKDLTMLLFFPNFSLMFLFSLFVLNSWIFYYFVYPGPSETFRGSNFCVFSYYSVFPLSHCDIKGE
jgi:hypothetical protein